jgi:hypothetical protein
MKKINSLCFPARRWGGLAKRTLAWGTLALCFLPFSLCKPENPAEETTAVYNVSGRITTSDGGAASGASVRLTYAADDRDAGQAASNSGGEYLLTGVAAGSYKMTVALSGYETAAIEGLKVTDAHLTGQDVALQKITVAAYQLRGRVSKPDGSPAAGASVRIFRTDTNTALGQAEATDSAGEYAMDAVPEGLYYIVATLDGYETGMLTGLAVEEGAKLEGLDIALRILEANANAIRIAFAGSEASVSNLPADGSVSVSRNGANVTVASRAAGTVEFDVSGATSGGSLEIQNLADASNTLRLTLNGAAIASASKLPPLRIIQNEGATIIELKGASALSDHPSNEDQAALVNKSGSLEFEGYGRLAVTGAAKHAIAAGRKSITVRGGDILVASAASDGFHAETGFFQSGGSLDITALGDGIDAGQGRAEITGGSIRILSSADDVKGVKADGGISVGGGEIDISISGAQSKGLGSKSDIAVSGGKLSVTASGAAVLEAEGAGYNPSYCTAIKSDAGIAIAGGSIRIESLAASDGGKGISADGDIRITGGTLVINAAGNGRTYTTSQGATDSYTAACIKSDQNVMLLGGSIACHSSGTGGKGVNAGGSITIGRQGADNADLVLNVGTSGERFYVSGNVGGGQGGRPGGGGAMGGAGADYANPKAVKCEGDLVVNSGLVTILCTQQSAGGEGMESKGAFTVNGGALHIQSYDDCINGGTSVTINGGTIFVAARGQDAIDSNGTLTINGGLTISNGVRGDGEAFDGQTGRYPVNGGVLVGTSGSLMEAPAGPQRALIYSRATAGGSICVKNSAGEDLLLFRVPVVSGATSGTSLIVVFSDPRLVAGAYSLWYDGRIEGGVSFNGYVSGGSYAGGSSKSFVIGSQAYTHVQ